MTGFQINNAIKKHINGHSMKFIVLNGSTKPDPSKSANLAKIEQLRHHFPKHSFNIYRVGHGIRKICKNEDYLNTILEDIEDADAVIWSVPVYIALVPAQFKRFIELIFEKEHQSHFAEKPTVIILTSIKVFDNTALQYMREICEDLNMHYCGHYSTRVVEPVPPAFIENFIIDIKNHFHHKRQTKPITKSHYFFSPSHCSYPIIYTSKRVVMLCDGRHERSNDGYIQLIRKILHGTVEIFDLNDIDIRGGCTGCLTCGLENKCIINDGFIPFYKQKIMTADVIIFLGIQKDRFLSWKWKAFFDRCFFANHIPTLVEKQFLCIVSSGKTADGSLLINYFDVISQFHRAHLCGVLFEDDENDEKISNSIYKNIKRAIHMAESNFTGSSHFVYEGARTHFNERISNYLYFNFPEDYRYYKKFQTVRLTILQKTGKQIILFLYRFKTARNYIFYKKKTNRWVMTLIDWIFHLAHGLRSS